MKSINTKHFKRILFTKKQIEDKCKELGKWVNQRYSNSENLIIVGLLKGCFPFMCKLIENIDLIFKIDFMIVSSYNDQSKSSNVVKIITDLKENIENKDVLIIEDILDTGLTLNEVVKILKIKKPKTISTLVFVDKKISRKINFHADKIGFEVPGVFVVGFGLDIKGKLRNLPYIAEFDLEYLNKY